jgi:hypothetical protein
VEAGAAAERRMAGREEAALAEMGLAEADRGSKEQAGSRGVARQSLCLASVCWPSGFHIT